MSDPIHRAIEPDDLPAITKVLPRAVPQRRHHLQPALTCSHRWTTGDPNSPGGRRGVLLAHGAADVDLLASELNTVERSAQTEHREDLR